MALTDEVDYAWEVSGGSLNNAASATPTWTRPSLNQDLTFQINLRITARGTGTVALDGSSAVRDAAQRNSTVFNVVVITTGAGEISEVTSAGIEGTGSAIATIAAPIFTDDSGDDANWFTDLAITAITIPRASGTPNPNYTNVGSLPAGIAFLLPTSTADGSITGTPTAVWLWNNPNTSY